MAKYRDALPQLSGRLFLTDGGLETMLVFHEGIDLPEFAAFDVLKTDEGTKLLEDYYRRFAGIARDLGTGFVLESPTWRASKNWASKIGYSEEELADMNRKAIDLLSKVRDEFETADFPLVISGQLGSSGDGYNPTSMLSEEEAEQYHTAQIRTFAETEADLVTAQTTTYSAEAIGMVRAAQAAEMPVVISFTVETDGKLPSGESIGEAIEKIDEATDDGPAYYMINCAHPTHFDFAFEGGEEWCDRIMATRVNSSKMSHEELDEAEELDEGNPSELAHDHERLVNRLKNLNVVGGCCGTDDRHVAAIGKEVARLRQ